MTVELRLLKRPELRNPHFVCGLPGSGYVGKLAVDHLINELKAELFAEVYSDAFPPHVMIRHDGIISLVRNELYYWKNPGEGIDLIIYTGDSQPITGTGDYEIGEKVLTLAQEFGVTNVYTFGAFITGAFTETPKVYAAASRADLVNRLLPHGVIMAHEGTISGMNGLLLGLAKLEGMDAVCLLGETSGYIIDAKAAKAVLEVFRKTLSLTLDMTHLEERAKEVEALMHAIGEMQRKSAERPADKSRTGYIS